MGWNGLASCPPPCRPICPMKSPRLQWVRPGNLPADVASSVLAIAVRDAMQHVRRDLRGDRAKTLTISHPHPLHPDGPVQLPQTVHDGSELGSLPPVPLSRRHSRSPSEAAHHAAAAVAAGDRAWTGTAWWPGRTRVRRCARCHWLAACAPAADRKSTRLNSSHVKISYAVFCL